MSRGRETRASFAAPPCPEDPQHGPLLLIRPGYWYCPHSGHYGKPGDTPTKAFFTDEDLKENDK